MKYKRRKTNVSKYVSFTNDKEYKKKKRLLSLKRRCSIAASLVLVVFSLSRMGLVSDEGLKSIFSKNGNGAFGRMISFVSDKLSFADTLGEKIYDFCFVFLRGEEDAGKEVYAKKEDPVLSDAAAKSDSQPKEEPPSFEPTNPCVGRISSDFGERVHPLNNEVSFHNGIDIAANEGVEIRACFDGKVTTAEFNEYSGNYVIIEHTDGYTSSYAHMSKLLVTQGQSVQKGEVIGLVGATGSATGPHLHFEIRRSGTPVNPEEFIS